MGDLEAIHFVKMDIEGYEPTALQGFGSLVRKHNPILLTEFNPRCLREIHGAEPVEYLDQLLTCYTQLRVLSAFGDRAEFTDARALMDYWRRRNTEIVRQMLLPDGMLHFDVIATNG